MINRNNLWGQSKQMWTVDDPKSYNKSAVNISKLQAKEEEQLASYTESLYKSLADIETKAKTLETNINLLENNLGIIENLISVLVGE